MRSAMAEGKDSAARPKRGRLPAGILLLASVLLASAAAQTAAVRGPVSGVVYDGAERAVRPVIGVPGAAYLGPPIAAEIDFAGIAPSGQSAVVLAAGALYFVRGLQGGEPRWRALEQRSSAGLAAWSPDSGTVAVWSAEGGRLRAWRGLTGRVAAASHRGTRGSRSRSAGRTGPGTPRLEDFGFVDGSVAALAVDGRGRVLYAVPGGLYLARSGGPASLIAPLEDPAAIAVAEAGLFVADRARGEVLEVRGYATSPDIRLFAGPGRGIEDPAGLAVIEGGRTLVIAEARPRRLKFYDIETRAQTGELEVPIPPGRLSPLGERFLLLNQRSAAGETLYVLDSAGAPAVYFIPAGAAVDAPAASVED